MNIDTVKIVQDGSTVSELTVEQYQALPLKVKIQRMLAGELVFLSVGEEVPLYVATKALNQTKTH